MKVKVQKRYGVPGRNIGRHGVISICARFFDESCIAWTKESDFNMIFLREQQRYANDLLKARGHLFLNEVYDMLGMPRSKVGQTHGWIYDSEYNHVNFGIYSHDNRDFVNGLTNIALLDFNAMFILNMM